MPDLDVDVDVNGSKRGTYGHRGFRVTLSEEQRSERVSLVSDY